MQVGENAAAAAIAEGHVPTDTIQTNSDETARPARPSRHAVLLAAMEGLAKWLELIRKVSVSLAVVVAVGVAAVVIVRETSEEGIVIDPILVFSGEFKDGLTPELAAQQVAKQIDAIQRAGTAEWRRHYLTNSLSASDLQIPSAHVSTSTAPIDLQIPGAPFSLRASMREVFGMIGNKRPLVRVSIVNRVTLSKLVASVSVGDGSLHRSACEEDADAKGMDRLFECISLKAMAFIDPQVAAAYVFQTEEQACNNLDDGLPVSTDALVREQRRIRNARDRCGFTKTHELLARVLARNGQQDLAWVPFMFGKVHLARVGALAGIDRQQQLSEIDQAIGRLGEGAARFANSTSAIATLFEAYVKKGIILHEATTQMKWSDDPSSVMQWHLYLAEMTFVDAAGQLAKIPLARSTTTLGALIQCLEGSLYYRQWLIKAHRRTKSGMLTVATGYADELALLEKAIARYRAAAKVAASPSLYMEYGNVLRAAGDFDGAAEAYLRAADLVPDSYAPRLNLAIAYLDRVIYAKPPNDRIHVLVALGASSNYLSWMSSGDPVPNLEAKIVAALGKTGVADDQEAFTKCIDDLHAPSGDKMRDLAGRRYCVDQAIEAINGRVISSPREPTKVSAK
jgi:tetratricopeptide (TPR) repeat protein